MGKAREVIRIESTRKAQEQSWAEKAQSAATAYERLLVPAVFRPWTEVILDRAGVEAGARVLDVACGTGVLSRAAAARTGAPADVSAVDPNPAMLSLAQSLEPEIEWVEGRAEALPFPDRTFDRVISQFGLMFFEDKALAMREVSRVTKSGGRTVVAVFDSVDRAPGYAAMAGVLERLVGPPIASAMRAPFSLSDRATLAGLLDSATFDTASIEHRSSTVRFASVRELVLGDVLGWFPLAGIELDDQTVEAVVEETARDLQAYVRSDGSIVFPIEALLLVGSKT